MEDYKMTKETTITLYGINELSEDARKKAINYNRYINTDTDTWCASILLDQKSILAEKGFLDCEISFSGFYGQGDGACFVGYVDLDVLFASYIEKYPVKSAKRLKAVIDEYVSVYMYKSISRYNHDRTVSLEWDCSTAAQYRRISTAINSFIQYVEDLRIELCQSIYAELDNEHTHVTSDEQVIESLDCNDVMFTSDGNRYN